MTTRKSSTRNSTLALGEEAASDVLSVTALNRQVKRLLEVNYNSVKVEGELSNVVKPRSGHYYFTLKDEGAQIRCAMFRSRADTLKFTPKDGDHVRVRGRISLYEPRGDYQLVVDAMHAAGEGALQLAFEQLKQKLYAQGLFEETRKKALPTLPKRIGVVTSPTGAAIRDILTVLQRRFPAVPVILIPAMVQGEGAAEQIVRGIERANEQNLCDVLIVGRGGGSLEDLWCFNDEVLAYTIFNSQIPIVSAVGHEIDFTIADFVADVRAPTPSAAAEILVPDQNEWLSSLQSYQQYFADKIQLTIQQQRQKVESLKKRLRHPGHQLQERAQRLDDLSLRLNAAINRTVERLQASLMTHKTALWGVRPDFLIEKKTWQLNQTRQRLYSLIQEQINQKQQKLALTAKQLQGVSPLSTLSRGFSICQSEEGQVVREANQVSVGDTVSVRPQTGRLTCQVLTIESSVDNEK